MMADKDQDDVMTIRDKIEKVLGNEYRMKIAAMHQYYLKYKKEEIAISIINDILAIRVLSTNPMSAQPFNLSGEEGGGYLVNSQGYIDFPTIGKIKLQGLEIEGVKTKIIASLSHNERLTVIDAITLAGDFTNYSARDSILIIREENGMRSFGYIDFSSPELFESPYFYLQQNDVLYVKPDKTIVSTVRDPATRFLPWLGAAVSLVALLLSLRRL